MNLILSSLCVWNVPNGKIKEIIKVDETEIIMEIHCDQHILILSKLNTPDNNFIKLRSYSFVIKVNYICFYLEILGLNLLNLI